MIDDDEKAKFIEDTNAEGKMLYDVLAKTVREYLQKKDSEGELNAAAVLAAVCNLAMGTCLVLGVPKEDCFKMMDYVWKDMEKRYE